MRALLWTLIVGIAVGSPYTSVAQVPAPPVPDSTALSFVEKARTATTRFHQYQEAVAAGYRRIGPDMPNMGEHWINVRLAMGRDLDPTLPAVLTYLPVDGERILTGVAYTVPVKAGSTPPALPFPTAQWHFHDRTVAEEAAGHPLEEMHGENKGNTRLAMLHAWIWSENPEGVFLPDNWTLPYVRLGLPIPPEVSPNAARTVFLIAGGVEYYVTLARSLADLGEESAGTLRRILSEHRDVAATFVDLPAGANTTRMLEDTWTAAWDQIHLAIGDGPWEQIAILSGTE